MKKIEVKTKCGETFTFDVDTNQEIESISEVVPKRPDISEFFEGAPLKHGQWAYFAIPAIGPSAGNDVADLGHKTKGTLIWVHNVREENIHI